MTGCTIAILALLIVAPEQSAKPADIGNQHQSPASHALKPSATAVPNQVFAKQSESDPAAKKDGGGDPANPPNPWSRSDSIQAVTAVATCLYFGATVWILCEMRRFNRRALSLSLASNRQTKKAAEAAKSSADTAKRALETGERADAMVEKIDLIGSDYDRTRHSKLGGDSICRVTVKNYGRTRAENLTVEYFMIDQRIEPSSEPNRTFPDIPLMLGAGQAFERQFPSFRGLGFTESDIREINNDSRRRLFVECKLSYVDVFRHSHLVTSTGLYDRTSGEFYLTHYEAAQADGN
jgi:hypothetical protein